MNRAFIYGDLLFETIKVLDGKPLLAHSHYNRLCNSAAILKYEGLLSFEAFVASIEEAVKAQGKKDARVRFVLHRNADGFYTPSHNQTSYFVDVFELPEPRSAIQLGLYTQQYKPCTDLSLVKSGNALLYTMAGLWAKEQGLDDALILNEHGCICEATSSNVFVVKGETVFTPALSEGCVDGVMRKHIISRLQQADYSITETMVSIEQLEQADAVFLTNAIQGIVSVGKFEEIVYDLQSFMPRII